MIPTAENFFIPIYAYHCNEYAEVILVEKAREKMIEFAKLHVTEALKQANEKATININGFIQEYDKDCCIDEKSILNAYPLDLIK